MAHGNRWISVWVGFWVLFVYGVFGMAHAETVLTPSGDDTGAMAYDCAVTLTPAPYLAPQGAVTLTLEAGGKQAAVVVTVSRAKVTVTSTASGATYGSIPIRTSAGKPFQLTILRRDQWLGVQQQDTLTRYTVPRGGTQASIHADTGWSVDNARIQRLAPVAFADDFMRTADDERGQWTPCSGTWRLASAWDTDPHGNNDRFTNAAFAQKAFSWVGTAAHGSAICTTGQPYWEDYTFTTALQPPASGATGVLVNMPDARNGLLIRWSPGNDRSSAGNRLALYRYNNGKQQLLAESAGGYIPGQWYRLTVTTGLDRVRVAIDGQERLAVNTPLPWRGGVGLYSEGEAGTVFADVTVYGRTLDIDLLRETRQSQINERFQRNAFMLSWTSTQKEWVPYSSVYYRYPQPNLFRRNTSLYGEYWLSLSVTPIGKSTGELWLVLHNDGSNVNSGYRAVIKRSLGKANFTCTLYRDARELAQKSDIRLNAGETYSLRFRHHGAHLRLELDGDELLAADDTEPTLTGQYPAYAISGSLSFVRDVRILGNNIYDDTFADAPTDWIGVGAWMPTVRWSCEPKWSFLGGWSHGDAVLWHKQRFTGDHALQAFVAPKMEYPRERQAYDRRFRDFGITLCGDGHDPRSGYCVIHGASDAAGNANQRTVLLRNGVEVASVPAPAITFVGGGHNVWLALDLQKHGDTIEFRVGGSLIMKYRDPNPLPGGVPAIWTTDNGIMVARARLDFAEPPQPRNDPDVILGTPWYPEWADINRPLTLDFPAAWSTNGTRVRLMATARRAPDGKPATIAADGTRLTFTPHTPGEYWYQITATDGERQSPPFHLALPAFNPALKRDDSHALLLYRFNDGNGTVVHDRSTVAPPLDLTMPEGSPAHWLPACGLVLNGRTSLRSNAPATKLMALARKNACTIEAWISADTISPPTEWAGCLLSWESAANRQNLSLYHQFFAGATFMSALIVAPLGTGLADYRALRVDGFRTGLSHLVITWDGTQTLVYRNGVRLDMQIMQMPHGFKDQPTGAVQRLPGPTVLPWRSAEWDAAARLLLGAESDARHPFLGTYYLLAIHDTCFTPAEVERHYQAGPNG